MTLTVDGVNKYILDGTTNVVGTLAADYGAIEFMGDGSWKYTLTSNVDHQADSTPFELFNVSVTDGANVSSSVELKVNIIDDAPVVNSDINIITENDGSILTTGTMPVYIPADDTTLTWDLASSTIPSPLYVDGKEVTFSVDGDKVIGTAGGQVVFTLDPTLADGNGSSYSLIMDGPTALGKVVTATSFDLISGGNTPDSVEFNFTAADGSILATATVTATDANATDVDTVNTRDKYIGVDNNWINGKNGNELSFDYGNDQVKAADFSLNGLDSNQTAKWTAEGVDANGQSVTFSGTVAGTGTGAASSNDEYFTISAPADGYISKLTFEADGHDEYRLGFEGLTIVDYNTDVDMSFNYTLTDVDNDTATGTIDINLSSDNFLAGTDGAENFIISDGADTYIENFDVTEDTLDLSEVIDTNADSANLSEYLNFASLDADGVEVENAVDATSTKISVDSNGAAEGGDITDIYIQNNNQINDISDLKIDYQND